MCDRSIFGVMVCWPRGDALDCAAPERELALKMRANLVGFVRFQRAGVGLAAGYADFRKNVENRARLYFQLFREIVNTNLAHPPLFNSMPPKRPSLLISAPWHWLLLSVNNWPGRTRMLRAFLVGRFFRGFCFGSRDALDSLFFVLCRNLGRFFQHVSGVLRFGFLVGQGCFGCLLLRWVPRGTAASAASPSVPGFFGIFKLAEVVPHSHADFFDCLLADARNLFELLGRHVGQRLNRGDAGGHQLLDNAVAQFCDLLNRRVGRARPAPASAARLPGASPLRS